MQAFLLLGYPLVMQENLIKLLESGFALQQCGDIDAAERNYRKVLNCDANNEFALNLLAVVAISRGENEEAITLLRRALGVNAGDPDTHGNLGLAYKGLRDFGKARQAFERSLAIRPQQPKVLNNLGNVLAAVDDHAKAISCFESALRFDNDNVDYILNLVASLKEVGRLNHALAAVEHAIALQPSNSGALNLKGELLISAARYEEAREVLEAAIEADGSVVAQLNLSTVLKQLGDADGALHVLNDVLAKEPDNTEGYLRLGVLYEQLGDPDSAARQYRRALQITPDHASSYYQLAKLRNHSLTDSETSRIEELLADPETLDIFRSSLYFALACEHEKHREYERSMDCLVRAQSIKQARFPYNGEVVEDFVAVAKRTFMSAPGEQRTVVDSEIVPVFVVGMPRSGTTLTEQIIASHSAFNTAGEVGFINDVSRRATELTGKPYPLSIPQLTASQIDELRRRYLRSMVERCGENRYVVDKNPLNFNYIGAIATLFPEARILYCRRHPIDNCLSIFRLPFDDNQGYSHSLAALGHFYRMHERLMAHWCNLYRQQILCIDYEETVDDVEQQARRILGFLGVEFEPAVLKFFETERLVLTPSAEQVRQPIYRDAISRWQRYGSALQPLIDALEEHSAE